MQAGLYVGKICLGKRADKVIIRVSFPTLC